MKKVVISDSDFSDTTFIETLFNKIDLNEVNFTRAEFFKSSLKDIDLSNSKIEEVSFDLFSVKGMVIDKFQLVYLAGLLEVRLKEN